SLRDRAREPCPPAQAGGALGRAGRPAYDGTSSASASSRRAAASSEAATSTRTPCNCSCGSTPPASSADTAARRPLLRSMPTISSASVRLPTTTTGTVAPSTISAPLLLCCQVRYSHHGRTSGGPSHPGNGLAGIWPAVAGTGWRAVIGPASRGPPNPAFPAALPRLASPPPPP